MTRNAGGPRAIKLADVKEGRLTPEEAEKWAKDQGLDPFERKPFLSPDEIMALEKWTAPMAAAWFIWRSPEAVRDQWNKARQEWTIWERLPGRRLPNRRGQWRLKGVGPATLADVFFQAGFAKEIARSSPIGRGVALGAHSTENNPYDRMRLVLERGWLQGTRSATGDEDEGEECILPGHWKALFGQIRNVQRPTSSGGAELKTIQRGAHDKADEILFSRAQVIGTESRISNEEFEWRIWTVAQILGWLAYRTKSKFRSLDEADIKGRTYRGLRYAQDFENENLETRLLDILLGGQITGWRDDSEVGIGEFAAIRSVWDISDVNFSRDVILSDETADRVREQKGDLFGNKAGANDSVTPDRSRRAKVGRPLKERLDILKRMQRDMKVGTISPDKLRSMKPYPLAKRYNTSRDTAKAARDMALGSSETADYSLPTINIKK